MIGGELHVDGRRFYQCPEFLKGRNPPVRAARGMAGRTSLLCFFPVRHLQRWRLLPFQTRLFISNGFAVMLANYHKPSAPVLRGILERRLVGKGWHRYEHAPDCEPDAEKPMNVRWTTVF